MPQESELSIMPALSKMSSPSKLTRQKLHYFRLSKKSNLCPLVQWQALLFNMPLTRLLLRAKGHVSDHQVSGRWAVHNIIYHNKPLYQKNYVRTRNINLILSFGNNESHLQYQLFLQCPVQHDWYRITCFHTIRFTLIVWCVMEYRYFYVNKL